MFIPGGSRQAFGAFLLAAGLILGGVVSLGVQRLELEAPGLLSRCPPPIEALEVSGSEAGPCGAGAAASSGGGSEAGPEGGGPGLRPGRLGPVDINRAGAAELESLDGVGPALAGRILELRASKGGSFRSLDELLEVKGIGPVTLARIKKSAVIGKGREESQNIVLRKSTSTQSDSSSSHR